MTPEEKHIWYQFFKPQGIRAKRQQIIRTFIVDFYIPSASLAIELDGSQHFEQKARMRDADRLGILVLRYSSSDISLRFRDVCMDILLHIHERQTNILDSLEVSEGPQPL